jgi:hypothetical protein
MKKIILGLFVTFGISSCSLNSDDNYNYNNCGDLSNVAFTGFPLECNYTIKEIPTLPTALAIRTQEKMDSFFSKNPNPCPTPVNPNIDFTKNYLIGIFSGRKPSGGYEIKITSIVENSCDVIVQYYETEPNPNDVVNSVETNPYDFVLIPKTNKQILLNRVKQNKNFATIGSFSNQCTDVDCQQFYSINDVNIFHYLNVIPGDYYFNKYNRESLTKKGDYSNFIKLVPTEILNLSSETKTYGSPDSADQGGIYFELSKNDKVIKVFIDNNNTTDQSSEIIAFKKVIKDKIAELKK